jgi:hypothetical protein
MNLSDKRQITHPDDLVVNNIYSCSILSGGRQRRVRGRFTHMKTVRVGKQKPRKPKLVIVIIRSNDTMEVPWLESKDWRDVTR